MTVVAGIVWSNRVWLGADGACCWDTTVRVNDNRPKVMKKGRMVVGVAGNLKETNKILRMGFPPLSRCEGDPWEYASCVLLPYLQKELKRSKEWELLLGVDGVLLAVDNEGAQGFEDGYGAVGCAYELALGALHATPFALPEARLEYALKAAAHHSTLVSPPFKIISTREGK